MIIWYLTYPGTKGYLELPQSFFVVNVWHIPQYNTLNVTSFSPVALQPIKSVQLYRTKSKHEIIHGEDKNNPRKSYDHTAFYPLLDINGKFINLVRLLRHEKLKSIGF